MHTHTHTRSLLDSSGPVSPTGHSRNLARGACAQWQGHRGAERPQAMEQARCTQLFPNRGSTLPGTRPPWLCKQTQTKGHPAAAWQAAHQSGAMSLCWTILPTSSTGHCSVPLRGSCRKAAGPGQAEAARLSVQSPHKAISKAQLCGSCWGRSKTGWFQSLQKDFLSHLHPRCLLFPEYEMHVFRKALADMWDYLPSRHKHTRRQSQCGLEEETWPAADSPGTVSSHRGLWNSIPQFPPGESEARCNLRPACLLEYLWDFNTYNQVQPGHLDLNGFFGGLYWDAIDTKHCVSLRLTTHWLDPFINYKMMAVVISSHLHPITLLPFPLCGEKI